MAVTPEDHSAMVRILEMMEGKTPSTPMPSNSSTNNYAPIELSGPGQVTRADVNAMADVLTKLNSLTDQVVDTMITESSSNREVKSALETSRNSQGVKVGLYQIMIREDEKRLAGKQYYSIYNTKTNDIIADDLSLYETALYVVKLLNNGKYANSPEVRKLFEDDNCYTAHKQDALRFRKAMIISERKGDAHKQSLYESRYQASLDRAMSHKREIKRFKIVS